MKRLRTEVAIIGAGPIGIELAVAFTKAGVDKDGGANLEALARRVADGEFDLVAVGRALIADPEWVNKVRAGKFDSLKAFEPAQLATLY